ncbi:hypothetical protein Mapa_004885 [Marchantia paleacea]|nr:hypothetical protein Mapa_004885 [Marchantia paleacea]
MNPSIFLRVNSITTLYYPQVRPQTVRQFLLYSKQGGACNNRYNSNSNSIFEFPHMNYTSMYTVII